MRKKKEETPQTPEPNRTELISSVLSDINARLNAGTPRSQWHPYICSAEETTSPFFLRRSTNILSLDIATGGGLPAGGVTQIAAPEGVGKNALCLQTIAQCQRTYGEEAAIVWVALEIPLDKPFAHLMGVAVPMSDEEIILENQSRQARELPELTAEELAERKKKIGTFVVIERGSTAKRLDAVVDLVASNLFQIVVIDSIAAILTDQRDKTPLDQFSQQSSEAFLLTEFQRKLWGAYSPNQIGEPNWTTTLVINQVRANRNQSGPFSRKWVVGGAHAIKHAKLGDIWLSRGEAVTVSRETEGKKQNVKVGKLVKWEIAKGKAGFHEGPQGAIEYHWDSGFQVDQDLVDTSLEIGTIVRTSTAKYCLIDYHGEILEEFTGKGSLYDRARDPAWFHKVYQLALQRSGISCIYKL